MNRQSGQRAIPIILLVMTFAFFVVFFTQLYPIVIFDTDSWHYAYYHRHAWPTWGSWNPSRVFPEVFYPLATLFGAHVVYPITHDYFFSLTVSYSIAVSAAVTLLTWMVMRHFRKQGSGSYQCAAMALLFLICHFLIFRSDKSDNKYMLLTEFCCTYFYYVLPNLLNCILVLWLMDDPELEYFFSAPRHYLKKSLFLAMAYFCVFSNLWGGMISGIYAGVMLLFGLIRMPKQKKWFVEFLKRHSILLVILALWAVAQVFEFYGGRAEETKSHNYIEELMATLRYLKQVLITVSYPFRWMTGILLVLSAAATTWKKGWSEVKDLLIVAIVALFVGIYLVLSVSMVAPGYIRRPDTFYGFFFLSMLVLLAALDRIMRYMPGVKIVVPLCLIVLACECNTTGITYRYSTVDNVPPSICFQVDNDILEQLQSADEAGLTETVLYVPQFPRNSNWPLGTYANKQIPKHLYKMGLLKRNITVTEIIPTQEKNEQFHIQ